MAVREQKCSISRLKYLAALQAHFIWLSHWEDFGLPPPEHVDCASNVSLRTRFCGEAGGSRATYGNGKNQLCTTSGTRRKMGKLAPAVHRESGRNRISGGG